ncbi:hypothetical protein ACFQZ4_08525 [Catellatospora coxensis]
MNDWRSSFSGVNDHESDWEQLTLYLVPSPDGPDGFELAWVALSSHDEVGDELRRRPDDPDLSWVEGTHLVANAGAGSHSGAYLPGDYLVRVQPPALEGALNTLTRVRAVLFPWTRGKVAEGLGIPYVDYRRGDGERIGPGTSRPWSPILIDSATPGCATTAACGGWTPPTRSAASARPPVPATSAAARSGPRGATRSAGPAWTRCRRPPPARCAPAPTGPASWPTPSPNSTPGSPTARTSCGVCRPGWRCCRRR